MKQQNKISPAAGEFLFEIDPQPLEESITALGGVPLLVRVMRSLGVPGSVQRNITLKERDRGYDEATYVESLVVLHAVGPGAILAVVLRDATALGKLRYYVKKILPDMLRAI